VSDSQSYRERGTVFSCEKDEAKTSVFRLFGYIMSDVERLRKPMQIITDFLLQSMKITKNPDIMNQPKLRVVK
jgi:hypothetical protein